MRFNNDLVVKITNSINSGDCTHRLLESDTSSVAGAIGFIWENNNCTITVDSFTNNGSMISRSSSVNAFVGGLIGCSQGNAFFKLNVSNSINSGKIEGVASPSPYLSGIVCSIVGSTNYSVLYLENNVNNGVFDCEDSNCYSAGIISLLQTNTEMEATIINNTNNAPLHAKNVLLLGGIVGFVRDGPRKMVIDHGLNTGKLSAGTLYNSIGGIVGLIDRVDYEGPMEVLLTNCENKGVMEASGEGFCDGLIGALEKSKATIDVFNSINKGSLFCRISHGIARLLTNAKNVVSVGYADYPFWEQSSGSCSDLFHNGTCSNCPSCAKSISLEGKYYVTDN